MVAALLSCAGIRLQAQDYDAWLNQSVTNLQVHTRQLLLVHGLFSSSATWEDLTRLMYDAGDTEWRVYRPNLYASQPFAVNRDSLNRYMDNVGIEDDVAIIGHSMGGIIARLASRHHRTQGILTIGTPNLGAPLAGAIVGYPWGSPLTWYNWLSGITGAMALGSLPDNNGAWVGPFLSWYDIENAKIDTWNTVEDMLGLSLLDFTEFLGTTPAIKDLVPGSPAMLDLNSDFGVSQEKTGKRGSIAPSLDYADYPSGPFILLYGSNGGASRQMGDYLQWRGGATFFDGLNLWAGADWNNIEFWDQVFAGFTLMDLGMMESSYWLFWNEIVIGGIPNDGVVPVWSMVMPKSDHVFYPFAPVLHTDETSVLAEYLRSSISDYFRH